jgi:predicted DNA-binding transcriptional regulator AlpA
MRTRANRMLARVPRRSGGAGLFEVPRLEELVADPEKVRVLDAHTTRVLRKQAIIALNLLYDSELERNATSADSMTTTRDRLLGVEEAGARLGVTADWLYRHHKHLPFTVRCGRLLRFSELGIEQYIRKRRG